MIFISGIATSSLKFKFVYFFTASKYNGSAAEPYHNVISEVKNPALIAGSVANNASPHLFCLSIDL
jgi:hypothetical protein